MLLEILKKKKFNERLKIVSNDSLLNINPTPSKYFVKVKTNENVFVEKVLFE